MILNKNKLISSVAGLWLLTNFFTFFAIKSSLLTDVVSLFTLFLTPGFLTIQLFRIKRLNVLETICLSTGLSIAFLMFVGLVADLTLPLIGIKDPLTRSNLLISLDLFVIPLMIVAYIKSSGTHFKMKSLEVKNKVRDLFLYLIPPGFVILSILGAVSLNNQGSNIFTLSMLMGVAVFIILIAILKNKVNSNLLPYSLYFIALSILFTNSLRGWYATGHDIQREYYVFQLTSKNDLWNKDFYQDAYNACLSITILPTLISRFVSIPDTYIYKIIFQLLFALTPVVLYQVFKKYIVPFFAFLSGFIFISFPTFINDMPMLNRQEIAFVFLSLLVLVLFSPKINGKVKHLLFTIFSFGIVVSHYSTAYIVIFVFGLTYLLSNIHKFFFHSTAEKLLKKIHLLSQVDISRRTHLKIWMVAGLVVLSVSWNFIYMKSSNTVGQIGSKIIQRIFALSDEYARSGDLIYSLFLSQKIDEEKMVDKFIADRRSGEDETDFYDNDITSKSKLNLLKETTNPITRIGSKLSEYNAPPFEVNSLLRLFSSFSVQLLTIIGLLVFTFSSLIKMNGVTTKLLDKEFYLLGVSGILLLLISLILPDISAEYGQLRMFQQLLMFLSILIIVALAKVFQFAKKAQLLLLSLFAVLFFLNLSGFISTITGGYLPLLSLDNSGTYYDTYYVRGSDQNAVNWLTLNRNTDVLVQTDTSGLNKFFAAGEFYPTNEIFPSLLRKESYVFLVESHKENRSVVNIEGNLLVFDSPIKFLSDNKNVIYNNGHNYIYR